MERWGPRGTIPPPRERPKAARSWPLQVVIGVAVVAGVYLVMRQFKGEPDAAPGRDPEPQISAPAAATDDILPATNAAPRRAAVQPGNDEFQQALVRGQMRWVVRGLTLAPEVREMIRNLRLREAADQLKPRAAQGNAPAIVALAQLAYQCTLPRPGAGQAPNAANLLGEYSTAALPGEMPEKARGRIRFAEQVQGELPAKWQTACKLASIDTGAVRLRLRNCAADGNESCLWQQGVEATDQETQRKHWLSAAMLGHPQAEVDLAQSYWMENAIADVHTNRGRLNFWLQAAIKHSTYARALLGHCELNGCNLQPPDPAGALPVLKDAALRGELMAVDALTTVGVGEAGSLTNEEYYAQLYLIGQLNELGCYGADLYPSIALAIWQHRRDTAQRMSPFALRQADAQADGVWRNRGADARAAQGCE